MRARKVGGGPNCVLPSPSLTIGYNIIMSERRPKLPDLLVVLQHRISWSELNLLAPHLTSYDLFPLLTDIERDYQGKERYLHAFKFWLDRDCDASWENVVSALRAIDKNVLALEIEEKYCTSTSAVNLTEPRPSERSPVSAPARATGSQGDAVASSNRSCDGIHQEISEEAANLQDQFVSVVISTKVCFMAKATKSEDFLTEFKVTLTTLPLSKKHQHLLFLKKEKNQIMKAEDIDEIFDVLDPYWNYVDYAFLDCIIRKFGTSKLKEKMEKYIAELETFEKKTSVYEFDLAVTDKRNFPADLKMIAITQTKDPKKCSLYEVRQFKNAVINQSTLNDYALYLKGVSCSSVKITLAVPSEVYYTVSYGLDAVFVETHQIEQFIGLSSTIMEHTAWSDSDDELCTGRSYPGTITVGRQAERQVIGFSDGPVQGPMLENPFSLNVHKGMLGPPTDVVPFLFTKESVFDDKTKATIGLHIHQTQQDSSTHPTQIITQPVQETRVDPQSLPTPHHTQHDTLDTFSLPGLYIQPQPPTDDDSSIVHYEEQESDPIEPEESTK